MRRLILLAALACGGGMGGARDASAPPGAAQSSGAWGLGECSARCERAKESLARDFQVPQPIDCWAPELFSAGSHCTCSAAFERRWNIRFTAAEGC